jgi:hypothetical protein
VVKKLLARYQAKRDFDKTNEPRGTRRVKASKNACVLSFRST